MNVINEAAIPYRTEVSRPSWPAIFAGVVIVLVVQLLLAFLGLGIGLSSVSASGTVSSGLGIGSGIWWIISSLISLFIGGWAAARMAGVERSFDGALHGLVTWGLASILTIYLLTSTLGALIGGGLSFATSAAAALPQRTAQNISQQAQTQLQQAQAQATTPQAQAQAARTARRAAGGAAAGAFSAFVMLILSGVAAAWGGSVGRAKEIVVAPSRA
jgi:hypothetical protein